MDCEYLNYGEIVYEILYIFIFIFKISQYLLLGEWYEPQSRMEFFEKFAKDNNFDPHDPNQWYIQSRESIMATKVCNYNL